MWHISILRFTCGNKCTLNVHIHFIFIVFLSWIETRRFLFKFNRFCFNSAPFNFLLFFSLLRLCLSSIFFSVRILIHWLLPTPLWNKPHLWEATSTLITATRIIFQTQTCCTLIPPPSLFLSPRNARVPSTCVPAVWARLDEPRRISQTQSWQESVHHLIVNRWETQFTSQRTF